MQNDRRIAMKKECGICKAFRFLTGLAVFAAGAFALVKLFQKKGKAIEAGNDRRSIKEYFGLCTSKEITCSGDEVFAGMTVTSIMSAANVDISGAQLKDDSFINLRNYFGYVTIKVPNGVNVKLDGWFQQSKVKNESSCNLECAPVVYVAVYSFFGCINVVTADCSCAPKELEDEDIFAE